jgi:hypothetical protein
MIILAIILALLLSIFDFIRGVRTGKSNLLFSGVLSIIMCWTLNTTLGIITLIVVLLAIVIMNLLDPEDRGKSSLKFPLS